VIRLPLRFDCRYQEDIVFLTDLPDGCIGGVVGQMEVREGAENTLQIVPEFGPRWRLAEIHHAADMPLHVVVGHETQHSRRLTARRALGAVQK
jgi:hypothetical protein